MVNRNRRSNILCYILKKTGLKDKQILNLKIFAN